MTKSRLEAFSDGVLAIIITIMVLELKIPHGSQFSDLAPLLPVFVSYLMSFVFVGIYWGNHHHLMHTVQHVNSKIIWANMGLLFFLSLIPFSTGWMGENHFDEVPVAVYAVNLLLCAIAYFILQLVIASDVVQNTRLTEALHKQQKKGNITLAINLVSIPCAFYYPLVSAALFIVISILWIIPDRNIEKALKDL
jgi:uncharacterized membrane protein